MALASSRRQVTLSLLPSTRSPGWCLQLRDADPALLHPQLLNHECPAHPNQDPRAKCQPPPLSRASLKPSPATLARVDASLRQGGSPHSARPSQVQNPGPAARATFPSPWGTGPELVCPGKHFRGKTYFSTPLTAVRLAGLARPSALMEERNSLETKGRGRA